MYKRLSQANALRGQLQSFAIALAKLCVGTCKALRWHLQSFALADAKHCVSSCNVKEAEPGDDDGVL